MPTVPAFVTRPDLPEPSPKQKYVDFISLGTKLKCKLTVTRAPVVSPSQSRDPIPSAASGLWEAAGEEAAHVSLRARGGDGESVRVDDRAASIRPGRRESSSLETTPAWWWWLWLWFWFRLLAGARGHERRGDVQPPAALLELRRNSPDVDLDLGLGHGLDSGLVSEAKEAGLLARSAARNMSSLTRGLLSHGPHACAQTHTQGWQMENGERRNKRRASPDSDQDTTTCATTVAQDDLEGCATEIKSKSRQMHVRQAVETGHTAMSG